MKLTSTCIRVNLQIGATFNLRVSQKVNTPTLFYIMTTYNTRTQRVQAQYHLVYV